jgi:hypothetical protein
MAHYPGTPSVGRSILCSCLAEKETFREHLYLHALSRSGHECLTTRPVPPRTPAPHPAWRRSESSACRPFVQCMGLHMLIIPQRPHSLVLSLTQSVAQTISRSGMCTEAQVRAGDFAQSLSRTRNFSPGVLRNPGVCVSEPSLRSSKALEKKAGEDGGMHDAGYGLLRRSSSTRLGE